VRKKRIILVSIIGAALALTATFHYSSTPKEPSYGGHPLSYWVASMRGNPDTPILGSTPDEVEKATNAINHIGPAALPFLVKWMQYEPARRRAVAKWLLTTRFEVAHRLAWSITNNRRWLLAEGSPLAFAVLGERAIPALDDLSRFMNNTNRLHTAFAAIKASEHLGTNAWPVLRVVARNTNQPAHDQAGVVMYYIASRYNRNGP
jgi:hypothetical protein